MEKLKLVTAVPADKFRSVGQPSLDIVEAIVGKAICSPSGDNAQPWQFRWNGETLQVFHVERKARHSLNRKNHASMIALGAVLESIRLSATTFGLSAKSILKFDKPASTSNWAEVRFCATGERPDPLANMISLRATDRRNYKRGTVSIKLRAELETLQKDFPGCKIHIQTEPSKEFMTYFLKTESVLWKNSKIVADLGKWLRLSQKEIDESSDGMSWRNIGITAVEAVFFRLIRRYPMLPRFLWSLGFGMKVKMKSREAIESSAGLICFSSELSGDLKFCAIGEMAFRTWLLLNANGFGVQPLSFSSTSIADVASDAMPTTTSDEEVAMFNHGQKVLQKDFSMQPQDIPVWMFRFGISNALPDDSRAPKQTAGDVLNSNTAASSVENRQNREPISWKKAIWNSLPKMIRFGFIRNVVKVPAFRKERGNSSAYSVQIAETEHDLAQAHSLLHDCYVAQKLMKPNSAGRRTNVFNLLPETKTIIVKLGSEVIGTVTLVKDGKFGIPSDKEFLNENQKLRSSGKNLIEVSALAIRKDHRNSGHAISLLLMKYLYLSSSRTCNGALVCTVHPRAQDFYEALWGFRRQGEVIQYPFANGALAVHLNMEISQEHESALRKRRSKLINWMLTDESGVVPSENLKRTAESSGLNMMTVLRIA